MTRMEKLFGRTVEEDRLIARDAVKLAKEEARAKGFPTCEYDRELQQPYLLYPNGERKYAAPKSDPKSDQND